MKKSFSRLCGILLLAALTTPLHAGKVLAEVEYFYAQDNTLVGKAFNGKRVNFEYDLRGQLLAVTDAEGNDLERYTYDPAGNRLSKTIDGVTTTYRYDNANQLVSSTSDGVTTQYRYDAAGRMVQAGDKTYYYNFGNNKVSEVKQNGKTIAKFECNLDGQISKAVYGDKTEEFIWDGLALVWRSGVTYVNEPYVTGGNPILAGDDVLFNDMLGTTLAVNGNPVEMTSFGETNDSSAFFTGKPMIEELGYSFLFRDYNPSHGRWTTADPLGYPDGWNNLAYVNNNVTIYVDYLGCLGIFGDSAYVSITLSDGNIYEAYISTRPEFDELLGHATENNKITCFTYTGHGFDESGLAFNASFYLEPQDFAEIAKSFENNVFIKLNACNQGNYLSEYLDYIVGIPMADGPVESATIKGFTGPVTPVGPLSWETVIPQPRSLLLLSGGDWVTLSRTRPIE